MKALFSFLSCLIMLALFTRCADDELDGPSDGLPDKGLVVRLSTGGGLETKTPLNSTGAYHHVEEVWAVLYKLDASATDPTDNENYDFVTAEKLDWNPYGAKDNAVNRPNIEDFYATPGDPESLKEDEYNAALEAYLKNMEETYGGAYGNGLLQQKDFELHSDANGTLLDAGTYRVLCIGLDEVSKTLYGLKEGDDLNSTIFTKGVTLDKAYATITNIKDAFSGELFAGWAEFQFEPDNLNIVEVEMKRRVAGVLCYVTDIPRVITDDGNQLVKGIRLVLNRQANNQVHLCRPVQPYAEDKTYTDFGSSTGDNPFANPTTTVLATYDFISHGAVDENDDPNLMDKGDIIEFKLTPEGAVIKENSLLMGAYLLPVQAPTSGATLSVELLGGSSYTAGDLTDPTATNILATFNATRSGVEGGDASYDILPNYIYHIGNKPEPDGTDKDEPVSLLGQKITVTPEEWTKHEIINVEYPSVPIVTMMELWTRKDYDNYDSGYVFDCIGITDSDRDFGEEEELRYDRKDYTYRSFYPVKDRIRLRVKTSVLKSFWRVEIKGSDMLYIKQQDGSYKNSYIPADEDEWSVNQTLDMVLTDFVDPDADKQREAIIHVFTYGEGVNGTNYDDFNPVHDEQLTVKQHNAIFVQMDNNRKLGFCHYDWSSDRTEYKDGETANWNYWNSIPGMIYWGGANNRESDGQDNYIDAKATTTGSLPYNFYVQSNGGCAMYKAGKPKVAITTNGQKEPLDLNDVYWYLPALDEAEAFFEKAKEDSEDEKYYNLKTDAMYWTSTTVRADMSDSYNIYYNNGDIQIDEKDRDNYYYMRQCCLIYDPTGN